MIWQAGHRRAVIWSLAGTVAVLANFCGRRLNR